MSPQCPGNMGSQISAVCALVLAIVNEAQTPGQIRPHRPLLAAWTQGLSSSSYKRYSTIVHEFQCVQRYHDI